MLALLWGCARAISPLRKRTCAGCSWTEREQLLYKLTVERQWRDLWKLQRRFYHCSDGSPVCVCAVGGVRKAVGKDACGAALLKPLISFLAASPCAPQTIHTS